MELITELYDLDIDTSLNEKYFGKEYKIRKAARALIFNEKNQIAILYVSNDNFYKLPGGGVEENEEIIDALEREALEEVGSNIEIKDELGIVLEYRNQFNQLQISYAYIAQVKGELLKPNFTDDEIKEGFNLKWAEVDDAIKLLELSKPQIYVNKYMVKRDLAILKKAKNELKKKYIVVVSAIIFNNEGKILILKRSEDEDVLPGYYGVAGGKVEERANTKDVLEVAIKREIKEEVGIEVNNLEIFESHIGVEDGVIHIYFKCKHLSGTPEPLEETQSIYWMNLDEIKKLDKKTPNLYENCSKAVSGK